MISSTLLSIVLSAAAVSALPVSDKPSPVIRRDNPSPSTYPLGDACGNEWQYVNFDPNNDSDKNHLATLHNIVCSGQARAYVGWGIDSAQNRNEVYKDFFADDDETKDNVISVLRLLQGDDEPGTGIGPVVGGMVVDNLDFGKIAGSGETCEFDDTYAYTNTDTLDNREKIHFCPLTWGLPEGFDASTCSSQGERPTEKIDTVARVVIHEMTHYSTVGPASSLGGQIVDQQNDDGETAYGINRAFGLIDEDQDDQPGKAESNADNFAYLSMLAWVSYTCSDGNSDDYDSFFPLAPDENAD